MKFLSLISVLTLSFSAYASPPEITRSAPPVINTEGLSRKNIPREITAAESHAAPADGGMCQASVEEPEPATLLGVLLEQPADEVESTEVTMQMRKCWRGQTKAADPFLVLALYRYEETLGVPAHARGILGAIWCGESAFRMRSSRTGGPIRGDWQGGWSGAHGPFQLHSWAEDDLDKCRLTSPPGCKKNDCFQEGGRDDLFAAAACWWSRVEVRVESDFVKALKCKNPWPLAEALVANQGTYAPFGCKARSTHWRELDRWRVDRPAAK